MSLNPPAIDAAKAPWTREGTANGRPFSPRQRGPYCGMSTFAKTSHASNDLADKLKNTYAASPKR